MSVSLCTRFSLAALLSAASAAWGEPTCKSARYAENLLGIMVPVYERHIPLVKRLMASCLSHVADVPNASFLVVSSNDADRRFLLEQELPSFHAEERGVHYCVESIHTILDHFGAPQAPRDIFSMHGDGGDNFRFIIQALKKLCV